jgi:tRNA dimethylallyltransferase
MQDGLLPAKELRDRGIFATRQLAKRQITWLRGFTDITRIDCLSETFRQQALNIAQQFIEETRA